jgi:transcription antitermination factor NusG
MTEQQHYGNQGPAPPGLDPLSLKITEPHWYAAYTNANHEKRVAVQLGERSVEHFLPVYESIRRWKDRRIKLELPLFPGYVFVRLALQDRLRVLQVPGLAKLVGFNGLPCALPESEIETMRTCVRHEAAAIAPHPYLQTGTRVRVKSGPLEGLEGFVTRRKGRLRLIISLDLISRSAAVEVEETDLESV